MIFPAVIPDWRIAPSPESITPARVGFALMGVMDSGLAPVGAPRNDDVKALTTLPPMSMVRP
jgi:hypothetical protein